MSIDLVELVKLPGAALIDIGVVLNTTAETLGVT